MALSAPDVPSRRHRGARSGARAPRSQALAQTRVTSNGDSETCSRQHGERATSLPMRARSDHLMHSLNADQASREKHEDRIASFRTQAAKHPMTQVRARRCRELLPVPVCTFNAADVGALAGTDGGGERLFRIY